ncbi:uncharacterized protein SCHCODRAFT_02100153 [Schizophyllum commune H4-8]|uniref:uncharacterized protein n=1 Tax=Schizophyllum commune (strain H4-8 / FGSC 9210) TaxID=578458 RepID=UPI00215E1286|nr:uncharacterized protein SCHCODRAFT_02100153 [Schizophyllum commune H4-8]KAI5886499.1 hypothetical protein SCHCODRAFT_02100153 [Schizophyllum commune H4-8]
MPLEAAFPSHAITTYALFHLPSSSTPSGLPMRRCAVRHSFALPVRSLALPVRSFTRPLLHLTRPLLYLTRPLLHLTRPLLNLTPSYLPAPLCPLHEGWTTLFLPSQFVSAPCGDPSSPPLPSSPFTHPLPPPPPTPSPSQTTSLQKLANHLPRTHTPAHTTTITF